MVSHQLLPSHYLAHVSVNEIKITLSSATFKCNIQFSHQILPSLQETSWMWFGECSKNTNNPPSWKTCRVTVHQSCPYTFVFPTTLSVRKQFQTADIQQNCTVCALWNDTENVELTLDIAHTCIFGEQKVFLSLSVPTSCAGAWRGMCIQLIFSRETGKLALMEKFSVHTAHLQLIEPSLMHWDWSGDPVKILLLSLTLHLTQKWFPALLIAQVNVKMPSRKAESQLLDKV